MKRADLATGETAVLHAGQGDLRQLGDGTAALLHLDGVAWLIEAAREERLAERVDHVLTAPRLPFFPLLRQHDLAVLVVSTGGAELGLTVLDVGTHRLAQLSDRVYFRPPPGGQPLAGVDCGQPWVTRHAGGLVEGVIQDGGQLFFVEQPDGPADPAALWILPADLSARPRRLAPLADPDRCQPPLTSPGGARVGFVQADATGARLTIGTP